MARGTGHAIARYTTVCHGTEWHGMRHGTAWHGTGRDGTARHLVEWQVARHEDKEYDAHGPDVRSLAVVALVVYDLRGHIVGCSTRRVKQLLGDKQHMRHAHTIGQVQQSHAAQQTQQTQHTRARHEVSDLDDCITEEGV